MRGLTRMVRSTALASLSASRRGADGLLIARYSFETFLSPEWPMEGAGRRELAELVTDHLLGDVHRDELLAVVDAERQADELRQDRRAPRPGLDHFAAHGLPRAFSAFLIRLPSTKGPFQTERATVYLLQRVALRRRMMNLSVALFLRVFLPLVGLPHGVTG